MNGSIANTPPSLTTPFEHIALAFSGGGFRAASFSLGVLSYLDNIKFTDHTAAITDPPASLLQKIRYISSASGGTITNAAFTLALAEGQSFNHFFSTLYDHLHGDQLLLRALEILNDDAPWTERPDKSRNLINAFSICYDELLFSGKTLAALKPPAATTPAGYPRTPAPNEPVTHTPASGMNVPLEEVCFNATEFFRGLPFRQNIKIAPDTQPDTWFLYGNYYINLTHPVSSHIKIADTLAASSCFPMGFEPLRFPEDFTYEGLDKNTLRAGLTPNTSLLTDEEIAWLQDNSLGIMDGGITDNQGLDSLISADDRRFNKETSFLPFDLCLVNDVGSQYMDPYCVPPVQKGSLTGILTYNRVGILFVIALLSCLILGFFGYRTDNSFGKAVLFCGTGLLLGVLIAAYSIGRYLRKVSQSGPIKSFAPGVQRLLFGFLRNTRANILLQMLTARINSTITLNSDVFLKRVRMLIYDSFYSNPHWAGRRKGNHVYDLSFTNDLNRKAHSPVPAIDPTPSIQIVAEKAYKMPTTLWFDAEEEKKESLLPCIVACGQFTTCYNLLDYTQRLLRNSALLADLSDDYRQRVTAINEALKRDWLKFCTDPFWLLNQQDIHISHSITGEKIKYRVKT